MNSLQFFYNILLTAFFPVIVAWIGQAIVFWLFSLVGIVSTIAIYFLIPSDDITIDLNSENEIFIEQSDFDTFQQLYHGLN